MLRIVVTILFFIQVKCTFQVKKFPLRMPNVYPDRVSVVSLFIV
jgi:hypothetical protein